MIISLSPSHVSGLFLATNFGAKQMRILQASNMCLLQGWKISPVKWENLHYFALQCSSKRELSLETFPCQMPTIILQHWRCSNAGYRSPIAGTLDVEHVADGRLFEWMLNDDLLAVVTHRLATFLNSGLSLKSTNGMRYFMIADTDREVVDIGAHRYLWNLLHWDSRWRGDDDGEVKRCWIRNLESGNFSCLLVIFCMRNGQIGLLKMYANS